MTYMNKVISSYYFKDIPGAKPMKLEPSRCEALRKQLVLGGCTIVADDRYPEGLRFKMNLLDIQLLNMIEGFSVRRYSFSHISGHKLNIITT